MALSRRQRIIKDGGARFIRAGTPSMSELAVDPERMTMTNLLDPSDFIEPEYNPTELVEELEANWNEQVVPGLSHARLQYINTTNAVFPFTLHFDATNRGIEEHERYLDQRKFILAHHYPMEGADTVIGGAPPRLLFIWPTLISLTAVMRSARFTYTRFNKELQPVVWDVEIKLQEIRDIRLSFEEVRRGGTVRRGDIRGEF